MDSKYTWSNFIFGVQTYIWSIAQFQQEKILLEIYIVLIYGEMALLVIRMQVHQTRGPIFKT